MGVLPQISRSREQMLVLVDVAQAPEWYTQTQALRRFIWVDKVPTLLLVCEQKPFPTVGSGDDVTFVEVVVPPFCIYARGRIWGLQHDLVVVRPWWEDLCVTEEPLPTLLVAILSARFFPRETPKLAVR